MAFLFKSKKQQGAATPAAPRNIGSPQSQEPTYQAAHPGSRGKDAEGTLAVQPVQPVQPADGTMSSSLTSAAAMATEAMSVQADQRQLRERSGSDLPALRGPAMAALRPPLDTSLYPWAQYRLHYSSPGATPFPRYGAAANSNASKDGHIYLMGGLINGSTVKGDLWMVEAGSPRLMCYPVSTTSEGPGPRVGHASLLVGNAFIVFGGDTKLEEGDTLDDTLYLLNTSSKQWSRALPVGSKPSGRYGHTLNILGSKIYVFGGQVEGAFFNDLVAFDLNALQHQNSQWEILIRNTHDGGPAPGQSPSARTNHTVVSYDEKLFLFGGTDGVQWFNDVWSYDHRTNAWSQLDCIGYIPSPREGHAAALVDDVMYIFGGRTEEGTDLGDLAAFRISTRRWYTFQNMGPSPSPRSGHSMTTFRKQIVVLGGEPSSAPRDPEELGLMYVLDTAKIKYPSDQQAQQMGGQRMPGMRRPSAERGERNGMIQGGAVTRDGVPTGMDGARRVGTPQQGLLTGQGPIPRAQDSTFNGPGPPGQRFQRTATAQAPSGPPPQHEAPQPRINGILPAASENRNFVPFIDTARAAAYGMDNSYSVQQINSARESPVPNGPPATEYTTQATESQMSQSQINDPSYDGEAADRVKYTGPTTLDGSRVGREQSVDSVDDGHSSRMEEILAQGGDDTEVLTNRHNESHMDSGFGSSPALSQQPDDLAKELESAKSRNIWYASELALARKAGYLAKSSSSPILDARAADTLADDDRPLLEALLKMRTELATVQGSLESQAADAAKMVAEIEKQRDAAIAEAAYAKAKLAAHGGSQSSTPQLDSSKSAGSPVLDRPNEMTRRLASSLEARQNLTLRLKMLTSELEAERRARQTAEESADAAQKRVAELDSYKQRSVSEMEGLRADLHAAQKTAREEAANCAEAVASLKLLRVDKEELSTRLSNSVEDGRKQTTILESLRAAVTASTDKAALLERKLDEEKRQRNSLDQKLVQLRAEHEQRTAELETTARNLHDAEELAESHAAEARTHRQAVLSGLGQVTERDEDEHAAADERVTILQQQVEAANAMIRKNQEHADNASEKLRRAEERIAGLETYQEQASREGLTLRKQLQSAMRDAQNLQTERNGLQQQLASQQLDVNAISVQHGALKELLGERGISPAEMRRSRVMDSPSSRYGTPDTHRERELEQQLESSKRSHEDTKAAFEEQWNAAKRENEEKLAQLDNDYQSAVKYLRGTEKMLSKMKQELQRYKNQQTDLETELAEAKKLNESKSLEQAAPSGWGEERDTLRKEIEEVQGNLKSSVAQLERQMRDVQSELHATQAERDRSKETCQQLQYQLNNANEQARSDLDNLRNQNVSLESRAAEAEQRVEAAEQKVQLLLDQVETSVGNYRRQSEAMSQVPNGIRGDHGVSPTTTGINHNAGIFSGHRAHDSLASIGRDSIYSTASNPNDNDQENENDPEGRNSLALDSLATELDALRSHWETTSKNYRLSDRSELDRTPPSAVDTNGNFTESLASWRRRLDLDEGAGRASSREGMHERGGGTPANGMAQHG